MRITFYHRKARGFHFSIEGYFRAIRSNLPPGFEASVATSRFMSRGIFRRLYNVVEASGRQGDINHITGDVHYLCYLLQKQKTILTVLDCGGLHRKAGLRRELFRQIWYSAPAKRVAAITVISEASKRDLLNFIDCDPNFIRVIHVSIAPEFKACPKEIDVRCPRLLQVGATPTKNIERTAEALAGLPCHLDIVGRLSVSQKDALARHRIAYSNSFGLTDSEVLQKYEQADIVIFPSLLEGFGMPIVEGNAVGRPVVTSNVSSMPEVAADAACLVNPLDCSSIRQGYLRIVEDSGYRAKLIEAGFRNVRRFGVKEIARQYCELYEEVAGRKAT